MTTIHCYDVFELRLQGPQSGNPYRDVTLHAIFRLGNQTRRITGFYDGADEYVIRFMAPSIGQWSYITMSNNNQLDGHQGEFDVINARDGIHGPVRVNQRFHFAHDDGTPYYPFGTTCYAWAHQPEEIQEQTLETLAKTDFNKIRMSIFPKDYPFNTNEALFPMFMPKTDGSMDFNRPNSEAFRHLEKQIIRLGELGIQADLILFHPYDRWGYATMTEEQNLAYVTYVAARFSAFHNVWWALANEYDFMLDTIPMRTWDQFCHLLEENDPNQHLRSIHNGEQSMNFDHRKPWISHVCIQNWDVKRTQEWLNLYGKPVINDEMEYEGNIWPCWGNITGQEHVHRFWITVLRGGYGGHGETYTDPDDQIWWAKGGKLHGDSWPRIGFLHNLLKQEGIQGLKPINPEFTFPWDRISGAIDLDEKVRFIYFGEHQPTQWMTGLPIDNDNYDVDLIDTWEMTITPAQKIASFVPHPIRHGKITRGGKAEAAFAVKMPGKPYMALRIRPVNKEN
ncbi:apiosidase-like domain-containing protein [Vibrio salinus]|uniref:apiosidase-like domain-containing protein n=1 Tax=Vibrio salinus TaxID=2899784 RepID=UPI001E573375|nr:DUF4038 domain-containing protein [Vibrio salinus]MCE0492544.1 DUF4038 domain-containing protein [Vibrio salinus]